ATFTDLSIAGTAGARTVRFSATGITAAFSDPVTITAGTASQIAVNGGDGQSATVGTAVSVAPSVIVTDASGNGVAGVAVTFAVQSGDGSRGGGGDVVTDVDGIATAPAWTLGTTAGANTLVATSAGLAG